MHKLVLWAAQMLANSTLTLLDTAWNGAAGLLQVSAEPYSPWSVVAMCGQVTVNGQQTLHRVVLSADCSLGHLL
jgi:hypothetical protein